jgi:hypothetical protein
MGSAADGLAALLVSATAVDGDTAVCASTALPSLEVTDVIYFQKTKTLQRTQTGIFCRNRRLEGLSMRRICELVGLFLFLCVSCVAHKRLLANIHPSKWQVSSQKKKMHPS